MAQRKALPVANSHNMRVNIDEHYRGVSTRGLAPIFQKVEAARQSYSGHGDRVREAMREANKRIEGHGIESLQGAYVNTYWGNIVAVFVNVGDLYSPTIIYDVIAGKFYVGDEASWCEWREGNKDYKLGNPDY